MKEMKISIPQKKKSKYFTPSKFLFTPSDEDWNKYLVQGNRDVQDLVDKFLDEYKKLLEETYNPDWNSDFYEELAARLEPERIEIFPLDEVSI